MILQARQHCISPLQTSVCFNVNRPFLIKKTILSFLLSFLQSFIGLWLDLPEPKTRGI